ncbi:MAG TPA: 2-(3-amino-3-carboxypropyl)histidine synthase [Nanoarchaeota archaeon]|nr:2-(3-amino-3-carboxypropyl)histidine synthase [Nanoarchaeota archaeon]
MKLLFINAKAKLDDVDMAETIKAIENYKTISLISTIQFLHLLDKLKIKLEKAGHKVLVKNPLVHAIAKGQVLGCDVSAIDEKADCVLYIGTGKFHPLGIAPSGAAGLPIICVEPFSGNVELVSQQEIRKIQLKQQARIAKFKEAKRVGILVTVKPGQSEMQGLVEKIKEKLEKEGKDVFVFIGDTLNPAELENFPQIDAWVNTACPRMVDDQELYKKPVVNALELI